MRKTTGMKQEMKRLSQMMQQSAGNKTVAPADGKKVFV